MVSISPRLEQLRVHGGPHVDHFANGLCPTHSIRRAWVEIVKIRIPRDLLHEGVGGFRKLGGNISNLIRVRIPSSTEKGRRAGGGGQLHGPGRRRRHEDRASE